MEISDALSVLKSKWHHRNKENDSVTDLFWVHHVGLCVFPGVIIMDCTYKMNRYNFSLLEIVGVTSTNIIFSIVFAFLEWEKETNCAWMLENLHGLFVNNIQPSVIVTDRNLALVNAVESTFLLSWYLLCTWHIKKNVLANYKKMFDHQLEWKKFYFNWKIVMLLDTMKNTMHVWAI